VGKQTIILTSTYKRPIFFYLNVHTCIDCLHLIQVALSSFITLSHFCIAGITPCACSSVLPQVGSWCPCASLWLVYFCFQIIVPLIQQSEGNEIIDQQSQWDTHQGFIWFVPYQHFPLFQLLNRVDRKRYCECRTYTRWTRTRHRRSWLVNASVGAVTSAPACLIHFPFSFSWYDPQF